MADLAGNLFLEDVGQPTTQELLGYETSGDAPVTASGALAFGTRELGHLPTLATDNVATDNLVQLYSTTNLSTAAEPQRSEIG